MTDDTTLTAAAPIRLLKRPIRKGGRQVFLILGNLSQLTVKAIRHVKGQPMGNLYAGPMLFSGTTLNTQGGPMPECSSLNGKNYSKVLSSVGLASPPIVTLSGNSE
jgi:hypothetical protein